MQNVPLFLVLTYLFIVINGIIFDLDPNPVIANEPWTLTLTRESNDPGTRFQISLLLNGQPAPMFKPSTLDFSVKNPVAVSSGDPVILKFPVGSYTLVATPNATSGSSQPTLFSFSVVDPVSQSPITTSGVVQSSSAPDGKSGDSSTNGPTSAADGSLPVVTSGDGNSGDLIGATAGTLPANTLSPSLGSGDASTSPSDSPNSEPSTSGAAGALTASKKSNTGVIAGAVVSVLALLALLVGGLLLYKRKKQKTGNGLITESFMLEVPASSQSPPIPGSSKGVPNIATRGPPDRLNSEDSRSSTAIKRQMELREQEEENSRQMADLESRTRDSLQWVSRAEHEAELARLRAENEWLRATQQSDWAMGLSDEMPPPYQRNSAMNSP